MATKYDSWLDRSAHDEAEDAYEEYRDEWIAGRTDELVKARMLDGNVCHGALSGLSEDATQDVVGNVARFFATFHAAEDKPDTLAAIAVRLYRELHPYVEGEIRDEAESDAATEFDKEERNAPTAAEARMECEA